MTPDKIAARENAFALKFIDSSATQFTVTDRVDIGGGFEIIKLKAPHDTYYYKAETKKTQICLHFTVGVISGDIATLSKDNNHVSVSYVVDRQGRIYQLFDDKYWSYHLGNAAIGGNSTLSKKSIGIEISNYGPLTFDGTSYKDAYGSVFTTDPVYVTETSYRGYNYYEKMGENQMKAVCYLLKYLTDTKGIPDTFKSDMGTVFGSATDAQNFKGIYCHTDVRADKFDWPPEIASEIKAMYDSIFNVTTIEIEAPMEPDPEPEQEPEQEQPSEPSAVVEPTHEYSVAETANGDPIVVDTATATVQVAEPKKCSFIQRIIEFIRSLFSRPRT